MNSLFGPGSGAVATSSTAAPVFLEQNEKEGTRLSAQSSREEIMESKLKEMMAMYENEKAKREKAEKERDEEKAERYEAEERRKCAICIDRVVNLVFECGHQACNLCGEQLENCHVCRYPISQKIRLFEA